MCKKKETIFSYNADISKNAYMNWNTNENEPWHNLHILAISYSNAVSLLIDEILNDNIDKKADFLVFPILYSLDQSIELYEKTILLLISKIKNEKCQTNITHDIKQLYDEMCSKIKGIEKTTKGLQKHLQPLKTYLDELYDYIGVKSGKPNIDFARYPIDKGQNPHFYIIEKENVVINIERLKTFTQQIFDSLEAICLMYEEKYENTIR